MRTINRRQLPMRPGFGRNVNHDSESRRFAIPEADVAVRTIQHRRHVPIFDQKDLGSCTGNAGDGCTGTGVLYDSLDTFSLKYGWNEAGSISLYSRATQLDSARGSWPPDDTGSDGLSVAKALKEAGEISGYLWAFTPDAMRSALMTTPLITGISVSQPIYNPDADGRYRPDGSEIGGHEIVVAGYVMVHAAPSNDDQVWMDNSWGAKWGVVRPGQDTAGSFWMAWGDYVEALANEGDVTQFIPATGPTPVPTPVPVTDERAAGDHLWASIPRGWTAGHHTGDNARVAHALAQFGKDTSRS